MTDDTIIPPESDTTPDELPALPALPASWPFPQSLADMLIDMNRAQAAMAPPKGRAYPHTGMRSAVLEHIRQHGPSTIRQIHEAMPDLPFKGLADAVRALASSGALINIVPRGGNKPGRYRLP